MAWSSVAKALGRLGSHGPVLLLAAMVLGLALPAWGTPVRPYIPELVVILLAIAAAQIEPRQIIGALHEVGHLIGVILAFQVAMPLAVLAVAWLLGQLGHPLTLSLVVLTAAPSISASPAIATMLGHNAVLAMRILILGTALLPLTVLPLFQIMPALGSPREVITSALRLLVVIIGAGSASWLFRLVRPSPSKESLDVLRGLNVIFFSVTLMGLVSFVRPMFEDALFDPWPWLAAAFAAHVCLQLTTYAAIRKTRLSHGAVELAFIAGNRNMLLFLVSLPEDIAKSLLPFIGCYQIPMFITPFVIQRYMKRKVGRVQARSDTTMDD